METIGEWLLTELEIRGWPQAELARRAGLGNSTLSRIISGDRQLGAEAALAIARALAEDPVRVFRVAGLLPPAPSKARLEEFREIAEILASLPDGPIRSEAMAAIRAIAESARRRAREDQLVET